MTDLHLDDNISGWLQVATEWVLAIGAAIWSMTVYVFVITYGSLKKRMAAIERKAQDYQSITTNVNTQAIINAEDRWYAKLRDVQLDINSRLDKQETDINKRFDKQDQNMKEGFTRLEDVLLKHAKVIP